MKRRTLLLAMLGGCLSPAWALQGGSLVSVPASLVLDAEASRQFRAWMMWVIADQVRRGPNPRWQHRDCAGLVRFAVNEAFAAHDDRWRRANGALGVRLPAEPVLTDAQRQMRNRWQQVGGGAGHFVTALGLVQENSRFIGRDINLARPGDLLFFDQGDDQHLMVWMGNAITYHTGKVSPQDNGLRSVPVRQLLQWKDTRWQPHGNNPNFVGVFRLAFLSA